MTAHAPKAAQTLLLRSVVAALLLVFVSLATTAAAGDAGPPRTVEDGILFSFSAPRAGSVHLAGEFNGWDPGALALTDDDGDGVWEIVTRLDPGRTYEYKFVVDGSQWQKDPSNSETVDDNHGGVNSVLSITPDGDVLLGGLEGDAPEVFEPVVGEMPPVGNPIYVAVIWHQHQPKYLKDTETGEYLEPWVRMHAIKDYYDMTAILSDYPRLRFTVNLTPILLMQLEEIIEGYENGTGTDKYLRMTLKNAAELSDDDKLFLLTHFFNAHWDNMIYVWPRYGELKDKKIGDTHAELTASAETYSEQDWRDLQSWFNLCWFDPDFQEGDVPLPSGAVVGVKHLIEKGTGFTEDDKREMIDAQIAIMKSVVDVHREFQESGQLEVITTPFYHPILPLLIDTDLARIATPGIALPERRFAHPGDARYHVEAAASFYEDRFGRRPLGMWPAEGAVAQQIVGTVADAGFTWLASDDQVLQHSMGVTSLTPRQRYQMYWVEDDGDGLGVLFRDHRLSDDIGFNFGKMDGVEAANSMMRSLYRIHRELAGDDVSYIVPIILDGENAWEWYRHDGKEFFRSWYEQMSEAEWLMTVTVGEFLREHPPVETLDRLWAGSWISHDFATWIGEPEENRAWEYLAMTRDALAEYERLENHDPAKLALAYEEMFAAEGSDWFWWYGSDQNSPNDDVFDEIFRGTLANVYTLIGLEAPAFLSESILAAPSPATGAPSGGAMAKSGDGETLPEGPVRVADGWLFSIREPNAGSVHLAGDFNEWSTSAIPMSDADGDGVWTVTAELPPGRHEYKFVLGGGAVWKEDPGNPDRAPDPYGGSNSVIVVE